MSHRTLKPVLGGTVAAVLASGLFLAPPALAAPHAAAAHPATASAPAASSALSAPVTGGFTDAQGGAGTFSGSFVPTSFSSPSKGVVNATGTLTGTLTDSAGSSLGSVTKTVTLPLQAPAGSSGSSASPALTCSILNLVLGPLDLNLLGLTIHLDTVHLVINANSGPGNLLGNLLCSVAGLLNGGGLGTTLANLLNEILSILNGL
jgi:hypothetical protein